MHDIMIYSDEKSRAYLTTNSCVSHYGVPALRLEGDGWEEANDLGPSNTLKLYGETFTAAELVFVAAKIRMPRRDLEVCRRFLAQWPEGPQL